MDTYQIDSEQLWYYMLYPIAIIGVWSLYVMYNTSQYGLFQVIPTVSLYKGSNAPTNSMYKGLFILLLYMVISLSLGLLMYNKNISSYLDYYIGNTTIQFIIFGIIAYSFYVLTIYIIQLYPTSKKSYESFESAFDMGSGTGSTSSDVEGTLQQVQTVTQSLQDSIDTFTSASDDTCTVIKGIEQRFLDNATAPSGNGEPPSKEEAARIKAQKLPEAAKQWNQKKQAWVDSHKKISIVECFAEESLSNLMDANQQLNTLLSSPSVQKIVEQIKRVQTSNQFAQKYIDQLVKELGKLNKQSESFEDLALPDTTSPKSNMNFTFNFTPNSKPTITSNPPMEGSSSTPASTTAPTAASAGPSEKETITTSNKLIKLATTIQSQIQSILELTKKTRDNYDALDAKANDPNAVSNLAGSAFG
jgi:hypothetical protein